MPSKSEKIKIEHTEYDRRRKLSMLQHNGIKVLHEHGFSYSELAKMFNCSKANIQNIIKPVVRKKYKPNVTTASETARKREYRRRKQQLFLEGKIK